ncbi:lipase family protein [Bradyrhizobium erythrophlei]|jgi:hypothetical protein|uniref:Lipase (Class 3) n=1 Tax=Bradyrhizobium erythrophlei TaxID=1437360 RepID=A0A1M5PTH3_9BRAD|nr:lipase family protein [Bradyrhizobium erythrophlei]SHH05174.1 Lipase (class 3) [Bradyrhizobium erythrophlei]
MAIKKQISFDPKVPLAKENAAFAVKLASMAYKTRSEIEAGLDDLGFKDEQAAFVRSRLCSCFIIRCEDVTAIAFKGTTNWREHLNNANVWPEVTSHGRVHSGLLYTMERLSPLLQQLIGADVLSGRKILLTGHSRGGALAQIFASSLVVGGHMPHSVWAFGSPMVGDHTFASLLTNVPVAIYRNGNDPISLFPPSISPNSAIAKWILSFKVVYIPVILIRYVGIVISNYFSPVAPS